MSVWLLHTQWIHIPWLFLVFAVKLGLLNSFCFTWKHLLIFIYSSLWIRALQVCQISQHLSTCQCLPLPLSLLFTLYSSSFLGSVFPPRRLISDDIECDDLLAVILLSHDFMTLILPPEQNLFLCFGLWIYSEAVNFTTACYWKHSYVASGKWFT